MAWKSFCVQVGMVYPHFSIRRKNNQFSKDKWWVKELSNPFQGQIISWVLEALYEFVYFNIQ